MGKRRLKSVQEEVQGVKALKSGQGVEALKSGQEEVQGVEALKSGKGWRL